MKQLYFLAMLFLMLGAQVLHAQDAKTATDTSAAPEKKTMKSVTVTDYDSPFDEISVVDDGDEDSDEDFIIDSLVKLTNKKGEVIKREQIVEGAEVSIVYLQDGDEKIVTEIKLLTLPESGKAKFKGLLDGISSDIAIVGGKRVRLGQNVVIKGKGKESFKAFNDPKLKQGSIITIVGKYQPDGSVLANEVGVKENEITKNDAKFLQFSKTRFHGENLQTFTGNTGSNLNTASKAKTAHTGNLKVGDVSYDMVTDLQAQGMIQEIGEKLLPAYVNEEVWQKEHPDVEFVFYLIQDDVPNAYAMPDGKVFVHTGLLKVAENSAQIAFVMSHEIVHVLYKHGTAKFVKSQHQQSFVNGVNKVGLGAKRALGAFGIGVRPTTTQQKAEIASSLVGGSSLAGVGVKAAVIAGGALIDHYKKGEFTNVFSKEKEAEADRVALYYTQNAGYDIREVPKFWTHMMDINSDPTYMQNLGKSFKASLSKNLVESGYTDLSTQLISVGTETLLNGSFNSVYISHPLSKKRYAASNKALRSTYITTDYSKLITDKEEYQNMVKRIQ